MARLDGLGVFMGMVLLLYGCNVRMVYGWPDGIKSVYGSDCAWSGGIKSVYGQECRRLCMPVWTPGPWFCIFCVLGI